jgi:hypothetical protein
MLALRGARTWPLGLEWSAHFKCPHLLCASCRARPAHYKANGSAPRFPRPVTPGCRTLSKLLQLASRVSLLRLAARPTVAHTGGDRSVLQCFGRRPCTTSTPELTRTHSSWRCARRCQRHLHARFHCCYHPPGTFPRSSPALKSCGLSRRFSIPRARLGSEIRGGL